MPKRPCREPGCPNEAVYVSRCKDHAPAEDRKQHRKRSRVYFTKKWALTRRRQLHDHPFCACGCGRLAEEVDHIVPINAGGNPWAPENLQSMTAQCHAKKSQRERLAA